MNQTQSYMDMHPGSHMSTGPSYNHPAPASAMSHYGQYQQPSVLPPSAHYSASSYGAYGYNPVTSPQSAGPLPSMMASAQHYAPPAGGSAPSYPSQQVPFDTTGQIAPPGMKPRVTATLWEDEGSLCFQVEAKGVCVARREDNHFINGTKLLNVAGMTRGRRDGILKSEKTRHVVKIGPMHLKGVWIPFERALEFANKEKITDQLYPLFVHNIGSLLYNPENASRTNAVVQAADRRRIEGGTDSARPAQPSSATSVHHHHHHHSMQSGSQSQLPPTPHSVTQNGRPSLDRAHTFPTPPASASSVIGMNNTGSTYDWNASSMSNGVNGNPPLSIDTGMNNARSMPTTPATTPPGNNVPGLTSYQGHQGYETKSYYATTPSSQSGYAQQPGSRYDTYKTEMGPPTAPPSGSADSHDHKPDGYSTDHSASQDHSGHHDNGYVNSAASAYPRGQYSYHATGEHHNLSPELTSSPSHQNTSARGTPRTAQPHWPQDYHTPPRSSTTGSLYSAAGDARSNTTAHPYAASTYTAPAKRGRDDDDDKLDGYKRQKMGSEAFGMPLNSNVQMHAIKTGVPGQR